MASDLPSASASRVEEPRLEDRDHALPAAASGATDWRMGSRRIRGPEAPVNGADYDSRPQEDRARRHIAYSLIGLLWLLIAAIFSLLATGMIHVADLKEFGTLTGPVVALVSAATGFYYGSRSK